MTPFSYVRASDAREAIKIASTGPFQNISAAELTLSI